MSEIEKYLLSKISENDPHKVSKYLQIKQWIQLFGNRLLRNSIPDEVSFIEQVILHDDCWVEVDSLKGVKLNWSTVGKKLLAQSTPRGGENPLQNIQKYKIACWYCFEDEITKLANQLRDELLENNKYATYGPLVTYWTHCKIYSDGIKKFGNYYTPKYPLANKPDSENLHYGFESAKRENNVEALNYFWTKLCPKLDTLDQKELLIYAAISYHLPFNQANNSELVEFALNHLCKNQYRDLLERDLLQNKLYSTLHHLISYFEFDYAEKLCRDLPEISYFDYSVLIYYVLYHLSTLSNSSSDPRFYDAGCKMLRALKIPSNVPSDIINSTEIFCQNMPLSVSSQNISTLFTIISSNLRKCESQPELKAQYNVHGDLNSEVIRNTLKKVQGVTLDRIKIEEALNKYYGSESDSSDEEDAVMSYSRDTAVKKLEEFNQKHVANRSENLDSLDFNSLNVHNNFGFITHAVAIKLFYSPDIQLAYYKKKPLYSEHAKYYEICLAVDNSAHNIVSLNSSLSPKVVTDTICDTINNYYMLFVSKIFKTSSPFVKEILDDKKYDPNNLWSKKFFELTDLNESSIELNFDVSQCQSDFSINFFSNLRLYNRLEKRKRRKLRWQDDINTTWKYSKTVKVEIDNKTSSVDRKDKVQFEGLFTASYFQIHREITAREDHEELPTVLSSIFTQGVNQISKFTACLHYLLFGTETIRNPSALIHNMMMLDLIKAGKLTWESAFVDKEMPMSIKGAIQASGIKNSKYNENYMPHKYLYESMTYQELNRTSSFQKNNCEAALNLLDKEKDLTLKWLELKKGEHFINECLNEKKDLKMEYVGPVFDLLQESCRLWYNIKLT